MQMSIKFYRLRVLCSALALAYLPLDACAQVGVRINEIRTWHAPERSRIVFDMNKLPSYKHFSLTNPTRTVIDIKNTRLNKKISLIKNSQRLKIDSGKYIKSVRVGRRKKDIRIVFDLKNPLKYKISKFNPSGKYQYRLIIDFFGGKSVATPTTPSIKPKPRNADILVLIDPGHGGEDPGAVGKHSHEKKIVLQIARKLKQSIDKLPGVRSQLTRRGDYYISLRKRLVIARKQRADLFISIHADGFHDPRARGASVYALSRGGATSEAAKLLADKENASDAIGGVDLVSKDDSLAGTMLDMSIDKSVNDSLIFGREILAELKKIGRVHSKRVEQAGFAVLKSPNIPSILIETAYITNPNEEKLLRSAKHQQRIATAISAGTKRYLQKHSSRYAKR